MQTKTMKVLLTILFALILGIILDTGGIYHTVTYHIIMLFLGLALQKVVTGTIDELDNDKINGEYHDYS